MNRCRDYVGFAMWFAGIGYAVLWPFAAAGDGRYPFAASGVCGGSGGVLAPLCDLPHPLTLPLGLHVLGLTAALLLGARVSYRLLCRLRSRPAVIPAAALNARLPGALPAQPSRKPAPRLRTVKSRKHFGLRGAPR